MKEENEAVLTKKILNAPLTEASHFRCQYNAENCILYLFSEKLNRCYATGISKEDALSVIEVLTAYVAEVPTIDFREIQDDKRLYG